LEAQWFYVPKLDEDQVFANLSFSHTLHSPLIAFVVRDHSTLSIRFDVSSWLTAFIMDNLFLSDIDFSEIVIFVHL